MANRCSSSRSRGGGTSSISALAASMRNFGFDVRAGGAAAQPGQLLADQVLPAHLGGGGLPLPLGLGEHERGVPALVGVDDAVVHLPGPLADRVEEPAVVGDHDQRRRRGATRCSASQATASTSRWLVGSSSTIRSWSPSSSAASEQRRRSPPESPATARSRETPASSTSTTSRVRGSAAHSWSARPPSTASRTVWVSSSVVALVEVADVQAAAARDPAGVGLLEPGHHLEQRGLAVAVAADDADPLARADAEGDVGEQRADAVRLGDPLEVDQVAPSARLHDVRAGHRAVGDQHDVVAGAEQVGRRPTRACVAGLAQEDAGRSGARHHAAQRAGAPRRAAITRARSGRRSSAGSLQVVVQGAGQPPRVAGWPAPAAGRRPAPGSGGASGNIRSKCAVDRRRGQPVGGRDDHPPPGALVDDRARPARRGRCRARCRRRARTARRCRARAAIREQVVVGGVAGPRAGRRATSAAAASAEPPAMPPATGIALSMRTAPARSTPWWAASRAAARSTMLSPSSGHAVASM